MTRKEKKEIIEQLLQSDAWLREYQFGHPCGIYLKWKHFTAGIDIGPFYYYFVLKSKNLELNNCYNLFDLSLFRYSKLGKKVKERFTKVNTRYAIEHDNKIKSAINQFNKK